MRTALKVPPSRVLCDWSISVSESLVFSFEMSNSDSDGEGNRTEVLLACGVLCGFRNSATRHSANRIQTYLFYLRHCCDITTHCDKPLVFFFFCHCYTILRISQWAGDTLPSWSNLVILTGKFIKEFFFLL